MPENLKVLRNRIRTVQSTQQITRAMEMVSAAKLRRAQGVLLAEPPYAQRLQELLAYLGSSAAVGEHPLFAEREGNRRIMVVFTADKGLCGAFNNHLIRLVELHLQKYDRQEWELYCIGKRGFDYFKRRKWPIIKSYAELGGKPDLKAAQEISDDLRDRFLTNATDAVHLYYQSFVSMAVYRPVLTKFLNLDPEALAPKAEGEGEASKETLDYLLEPSAEDVFNSLLPRYLTSKIYITMAEVFTSEHSARMIAMNNATKNCDELSDQLTLKMNKARQAQITNELIDIVGGAAAV